MYEDTPCARYALTKMRPLSGRPATQLTDLKNLM